MSVEQVVVDARGIYKPSVIKHFGNLEKFVVTKNFGSCKLEFSWTEYSHVR